MAFERPPGDVYVLLEAITNDAAQEIRKLRVDPATNALLTSGGGGGGDSNLIEIAGNPVLEEVPGGLLMWSQPHERPVYSAAARNIVPAAAATDIATLSGSAGKQVFVHNIVISGNASPGINQTFVALKRSTANTGGTTATITPTPWDNANPAVGAAVKTYSANAAALGALVGEYGAWRYNLPVGVTVPVRTLDLLASNVGGGQSLVIESGEFLCVNLNGGTAVAGNVCIIFVWTEE